MLMAWWRSPIAALDDAPSGPRQASIPHDYWAVPASKLLAALHSSPDGLGARAAALRLKRYGPNLPGETRRLGAVRLFLRQYESPLILILVAAAAVAALVRDWTNAVIVLLIVLGSGVLSFAQEYRASTALEKLRAKVRITCTVLRGGKAAVIPSSNVVPGDIVLLSAGSLIPADGVLLDAKDFFVSQAVLTGESFPTEKMPAFARVLPRSPSVPIVPSWAPRCATERRACW
jgi:Mg2+-importing ATPase